MSLFAFACEHTAQRRHGVSCPTLATAVCLTFTSSILPPYLRRARNIEELVDFCEKLDAEFEGDLAATRSANLRIFEPIGRFDLARLAARIDRAVPAVEHSSELLATEPSTLGPVARIQRARALAAIGEQARWDGDVAFEEASEVAGWITPVPGGVGPMTRVAMLQNTLMASRNFA